MKKYILLYGEKKLEDNICITNMFKINKRINLGWTDFDYTNNMNIIEEEIKKGTSQLIFLGLEIGWDKLIIECKHKFKDLKIKVICSTQDSLLYYDYERENFFRMLELSKEGLIDRIAFLRKSQYELYNILGYNCSYLAENYILDNNKYPIKKIQNGNSEIQLGIYPLNYTWDKNIFNQLCIPRFLAKCNVNYNCIDQRMKEFMEVMKIESEPEYIKNVTESEIIEKIRKNDVIVSTSFTEYMHPIFFMSMEQGIPCLIGNNSDFFDQDDELKSYIVTNAEDNAIFNAKKIDKILKNKEKIVVLYRKWKDIYNEKSKELLNHFINE